VLPAAPVGKPGEPIRFAVNGFSLGCGVGEGFRKRLSPLGGIEDEGTVGK
jgi:hypothetical protein